MYDVPNEIALFYFSPQSLYSPNPHGKIAQWESGRGVCVCRYKKMQRARGNMDHLSA